MSHTETTYGHPTTSTLEFERFDFHRDTSTKRSRTQYRNVEGTCYSLSIGITILVALSPIIALMWAKLFSAGTPQAHQRPFSTCTGSMCDALGADISNSISEDVDVCTDFYLHVCGKWDSEHRMTVIGEQYEKFLVFVARRGSPATVLPGNQSAVDKAIRFFESCYAIADNRSDETAQTRLALLKMGIRWPAKSNLTDAISTLMRTRNYWRLDLVFLFYVLGAENNVIVAPSLEFWGLVSLRDKLIAQNIYSNYFEMLRTSLLSGTESDVMTFTELNILDEAITRPLAESLNDPSDMDGQVMNINALNELVGQTLSKRWMNAFQTYLGVPPNETSSTSYTRVNHFIAFNNILTTVGELAMQRYVEWCLVQLISNLANRKVVRFLREADIVKHDIPMGCVRHTEARLGWALLAPAVEQIITRAAFKDVASLFLHISLQFQIAAKDSSWFLPDYNVAVIGKDSIAVLEYAKEYLDTGDLDELYSRYPDMNASFTGNWLASARGQSESESSGLSTPLNFYVDLAEGPERAIRFSTTKGVPNFVFMPHVLMPHLHDERHPTSVKYGILGSVVASALSFVNVHKASAENRLNRSTFQVQRHCLYKGTFDTEAIMALFSFTSLWRAFSRSIDTSDVRLPKLEQINREQLFMYSWCYFRCGQASRDGTHVCNQVLKNTMEFGEVFRCRLGSPMNPVFKCRYF